MDLLSVLKKEIENHHTPDEQSLVNELISQNSCDASFYERVQNRCTQLIKTIRVQKKPFNLESLLQGFPLSSKQGKAIMGLAEALLRIPDGFTQYRLLDDKLCVTQWEIMPRKNLHWFVYSSQVVLSMIHWLSKSTLIKKILLPILRPGAIYGIHFIGNQFVFSQNIHCAIKKLQKQQQPYFSFDMLGESAKTEVEANTYYESYLSAINAFKNVGETDPQRKSFGISVKLSAICARYEVLQSDRVYEALYPRLKVLAGKAKLSQIPLTIDAEESYRLDLSLTLLESLLKEGICWDGLGLAVQAYQKRALAVIDYIAALGQKYQSRLAVRLVKGAYWDTEIKWTQERGFKDYPVFTRKSTTDISYMLCAQKMLEHHQWIYSQFATHNIYTVSYLQELVKGFPLAQYEFQRLYGMGEALYQQIEAPCRVYAPIGTYDKLLSYLIRRLLENGSSSSFVYRIYDNHYSNEELAADPFDTIKSFSQISHPKIPLPSRLFTDRPNSEGVDLQDSQERSVMEEAIRSFSDAVLKEKVLSVDENALESMLETADRSYLAWTQTPVKERAACLERLAKLLAEYQPKLCAYLVREAGKTVQDALSEVREAIDFCWYYAVRAKMDLETQTLPGPTGELNQLFYSGRGVIVCISPWNFPLAIFLGQVVAALVAGNTVIAKPAAQTQRIAQFVMGLVKQAGVPKTVIHCATVPGRLFGEQMIQDRRVKGILFTGSTQTAQWIQSELLKRSGEIIPFVAETGGQNAMIVDSSALPEQVVTDIMTSAFNSAGQRCSALRVLFIQEDVAPTMIEMLKGAMAELQIGDPLDLKTDVGPVIDESARDALIDHQKVLDERATRIYACHLSHLPDLPKGVFFAPCAYLIKDLSLLVKEHFGPILHVMTYRAQELNKVVEAINELGYGLTLGIHSRIEQTVQDIIQRARVGNVYVNRNMVGAVVGVQPFGGEGLSGTGPKAGGPHMLLRLVKERTVSINTVASGGNVELTHLGD